MWVPVPARADRIAYCRAEIVSLSVLAGEKVVFSRAQSARVFFLPASDIRLAPAGVVYVGRPRHARPVDYAELAQRFAATDAARADDAVLRSTDPKRLCAAIISDRAQGYSLVDRESETGLPIDLVPIRLYDGAIIAPSTWARMSDRISTNENGLPIPAAASRRRCSVQAMLL